MFLILSSCLLVVFLVVLLSVVKIMLSDASINQFSREEASSYECGFEQYSLSRVPLSIRYFILTLVFLIFDLEIMLLVFSPVDFILSVSKSYLLTTSLLFIIVLFAGLVYEWLDGSLDWIM